MSITSFYYRFRKYILGGLLLLFVIIGLYVIFGGETQPEYVTEVVEKGDIIQTVETVGTVVSDKDLSLEFPMSGIVAAVYVKEGDIVRPGQQLAQLRAGSRSASIAGQVAAVASAEAALRALQEGTRPEEIAIAQAELENKRAALTSAQTSLANAEQTIKDSQEELKALRAEATASLSGDISVAVTTLSSELVSAENALVVVDDVFSNLAVQDALLLNNPAAYTSIRTGRSNAQQTLNSARTRLSGPLDYQNATATVDILRNALNAVSAILDQSFDVLTTTPEIGSFTASLRETQRGKISAQRTIIQTSFSDLNTALSGLRDASATYETRITAEESSLRSAEGTRDRAKSDILNYETAIRISQAQLDLQKAGARKTDIDAAAARVRQARADLARTSADYSDTILVSPVDGVVTKVNVRVGESTPVEPAVTVLGSVPYRIEMFVSEIDVPLLKLSQSGTINLDAFPDTDYKVRVSEIDTAPTEQDGISRYRVKLDFLYPHDEFRVGMTGDVTVITAERKNVISVPSRAVIENDEGEDIVRILDGEEVKEQKVVTGTEGEAGDIEILEGLEGGETVIVLEKTP